MRSVRVALIGAATVMSLVAAGCSDDEKAKEGDSSAGTSTTSSWNTASSTPGAGSAPPDSAAAPASAPPASVVAAPTALTYPVDGGTVSMPCHGRGRVPVILVAGGTDPASTWDALVASLGDDTLTCRFDAPGIGASSAPTAPVTAARRAQALASALSASGLPGPYLLVAHSLGGPTVRQFGAAHPELVAGAVLLDPTTRLAIHGLHDELTASGWDVAAADAEADATVTWPSVPLVVMSHDPMLHVLGSRDVEAVWTIGQREYVALSPKGRQEIVDGSGHYIYRDRLQRVSDTIENALADVGGP